MPQPEPRPDPEPEPEPAEDQQPESEPAETDNGEDEEKSYPVARPSDEPGRVVSPYPPYNTLDVKGLESGSLALDPTVGKIFRVP